MTLDAIKAALPDYAKDLRLNLDSVLGATNLTPQQQWGTALAAACAARNGDLRQAVEAAAAAHLDEAAMRAAKAAAAIMGMNNIYYRFLHLVEQPEYKSMPARLRMQIIARPGVDALDFELWSLAVSAINGCGSCIESHEHEVLGKGATRAMVQDAVRIAAVLHAVAVALDIAGARVAEAA